MHSQNHRKNHDFQIAYFIAGQCHTPDAAYAVLCDLKEDREDAIANYHVVRKRQCAKLIRAKKKLTEAEDETDILEATADIEEIEHENARAEVLYNAATAELAFINQCIEKLQPLRKYTHLSDPDAHEAIQQEEWLYELLRRAENQMICLGYINPADFDVMRSHPQFESVIQPALYQLKLNGKPKQTESVTVSLLKELLPNYSQT